MENTTITILESVTEVNGNSKNSRINNTEISLGEIVFERNDGLFFENIMIENNDWRPFLRLSTNFIELSNLNNKKSKTIIIKKWKN